MKKLLFAVFVALLVNSSHAFGDPLDFGGWSERMKGRGDRVPPSCQIDVPKTASSPFFVMWYCDDEDTPDQNIKTELWLYRKDAPAGELVKTFLGFPASVFIDEGLLKITDPESSFKDGLPLGIRLAATDRAGNTSISPMLTVIAKTDSINQCNLQITKTVTQTSDSTTDSEVQTSESYVTVTNALVRTVETAENTFTMIITQAAQANPCEIDTICSAENNVRFVAQVIVQDGTTTGKMSIAPGNLTLSASTATASVVDKALKKVEMSGTIDFEGQPTTVSLNCSY